MTTFDELGVSKKLCDAIDAMGWTEPTPIQIQAVPEGLAGKDMFAQAQTGTGKTGAYSMIVLGRIRHGSRDPLAIVLTPTRELADQVSREMRRLAQYTRHNIVAVYGGASIVDQIERVSAGCDVVVGTPGRVLDLCGRGILNLDSVRELVLDEADRMLDMGFIEDMERIISMTPESRQTMMFSATISDDVRGVMDVAMRDPLEVSVSQDEIVSDLVTQYYVVVNRSAKRTALMEIVANGNPKTVIFCSTKKMVDDLMSSLNDDGVKSGCIHGDMPQHKREKTIRNFKNGRVNILIATDVAARGLDIDDIECVLNYDSPSDPETYTHRIGRAGRAGRTGVAITFITPREDRRIEWYEEYMGREIERVSRKNLGKLEIANPELKGLHADERARREEEYNSRFRSDRREKRRYDGPKEEVIEFRSSIVVSMDIGRSSGITRTDIMEFIKSSTGIDEESIGRIGMKDETTYVEVDPTVVDVLMTGVNRAELKGNPVKATIAPKKSKYREKEPEPEGREYEPPKRTEYHQKSEHTQEAFNRDERRKERRPRYDDGGHYNKGDARGSYGKPYRKKGYQDDSDNNHKDGDRKPYHKGDDMDDRRYHPRSEGRHQNGDNRSRDHRRSQNRRGYGDRRQDRDRGKSYGNHDGGRQSGCRKYHKDDDRSRNDRGYGKRTHRRDD